MASRVQDLAFLLGAVIALTAFGLIIVLTRPGTVTAGTPSSPTPTAAVSFPPIPSIVNPTQAPVTSTPAPTTAAPVPTTAAPTPSPAPRTSPPLPLPSASR